MIRDFFVWLSQSVKDILDPVVDKKPTIKTPETKRPPIKTKRPESTKREMVVTIDRKKRTVTKMAKSRDAQ